MPIKLHIATFELVNLDDMPGQEPTHNERIALVRPHLVRLKVDILCLQEVNGQKEPGQPRRLLALPKLLANTPYAGYQQVSTMTEDGTQVCDERNLVILSRFQLLKHHQYKHDFAPALRYRRIKSPQSRQRPRPAGSQGNGRSSTPGSCAGHRRV